ncbi:TonB family protein [Rapidithrix thailandica]|uniref:TonB family protein n=1 Tax=Rapidithrix thailandica TaxID=413964 RepID=A0AAW9S043_9BACT
MSSILVYSLEVNCFLLLAVVVYALLLRRQTSFQFSRCYLVLSMLFSLLAPKLLWPFSLLSKESLTIAEYIPIAIVTPRPVAGAAAPEEVAWETVFLYVYLIGVIALSAIFLYRMARLWFFIRSTPANREGGFFLLESKSFTSSFSFFHYVFLSKSLRNEQERNQVLLHELAHIRQGHSWDILLVELLKIICWCSPVSWWLNQEVRLLHEYLADREVLRQVELDDYKDLLARQALSVFPLTLESNLNQHNILNRLEMMTKNNPTSPVSRMMAIFSLCFMLGFFACQNQALDDLDKMNLTMVEGEYPPEVQAKLEALQAEFPNDEFAYVEIDNPNHMKAPGVHTLIEIGESAPGQLQQLHETDPQTVVQVFMLKEKEKIGIILKETGNFDKLAEYTAKEDVFSVVEQSAKPVGGFRELYTFLSENIRYPQQALANKIEGKVYIEFVVNKDGTLSGIKSIRGIGGGCDEEAVRVMKLAAAWEPAVQRGAKVKQKIVLPINFSLGAPVTGEHDGTAFLNKLKVDYDLEKKSDTWLISGVVHSDEGEPLNGAVVIVKGTTQGTVTNAEGKFVIELEEKLPIVVQYVGYQPREIHL